jgi:hypothetical protein
VKTLRCDFFRSRTNAGDNPEVSIAARSVADKPVQKPATQERSRGCGLGILTPRLPCRGRAQDIALSPMGANSPPTEQCAALGYHRPISRADLFRLRAVGWYSVPG